MTNDPRLDLATKLRPGNAVAALITIEGRYILQLRDDKNEIFFPRHWGCFGGACEIGETPERALVRELREEIDIELDPSVLRYFSRFDFDLGFAGLTPVWRYFYEIELPASTFGLLRLREGADMRAFPADEILTNRIDIVPYDGFALWLHINRARLENSSHSEGRES